MKLFSLLFQTSLSLYLYTMYIFIVLSKKSHLINEALWLYWDREDDMTGVCLSVQAAGVNLTAIILSCLFHLFVTVAAEGRAEAMLAIRVLFYLELSNLRIKSRNPSQNDPG